MTQNGKVVRETIRTNGTVTAVMDFIYNESGTPFTLKYSTNGGSSFTTYYYVVNLQGDVVKLVNANGTAYATYTYNAWGEVLTATGSMASINPLRYRGYYYDTETGFYYLQSRYYDPVTQRFINADSYESTGQGFVGTNMFAYCNNNPVYLADSEGNEAIVVVAHAFRTFVFENMLVTVAYDISKRVENTEDYSISVSMHDGVSISGNRFNVNIGLQLGSGGISQTLAISHNLADNVSISTTYFPGGATVDISIWESDSNVIHDISLTLAFLGQDYGELRNSALCREKNRVHWNNRNASTVTAKSVSIGATRQADSFSSSNGIGLACGMGVLGTCYVGGKILGKLSRTDRSACFN